MSDELKVTTPDEYVKLTTRKVKVTSGAVFNIRAMNASSMVYLLGLMPEEGIEGRNALNQFVRDNFTAIVTHVVQPNIIEPKLEDEQLFFLDVVDVLTELMDISGFTVQEIDEGFREPGDISDS